MVVNTDLTITTEKLVELFARINDGLFGLEYAPLFDSVLGSYLDLPLSKSNKIKRNYQSSSQKRDAYLDLYVTDHPCPSWRQVAELLRNVRLPSQADVVESTYVQGIMIILIHSLSVK